MMLMKEEVDYDLIRQSENLSFWNAFHDGRAGKNSDREGA